MPAVLLLITVGAIMVYSAIEGVTIADAVKGVKGDPLDPKGGFVGGIGGGSIAGSGGLPVSGAKAGSPVAQGTSVGPEHDTMGLPGYPAHDYFAPAGSPAVAPVSGTVSKLSGTDPIAGPPLGVHGPFGYSVYIKGDDGNIYYLTHMGSRTVHVGQQVNQGEQIGTVGDYAKWGGANHIHMGVHRG